jgi:alditol oxidase
LRRGDPGFDGIVVGLDAFGIVTQVTIDIEPDFAMRQDGYERLAWAVLLDDFDTVMPAGYSVSLMTMWSGPAVTRLWIKTRLADGVPERVSAAHPGAVPAARPSAAAAPEAMLRLNPFVLPSPWSERLPHFRTDVIPGPARHLQREYMLPRALGDDGDRTVARDRRPDRPACARRAAFALLSDAAAVSRARPLL